MSKHAHTLRCYYYWDMNLLYMPDINALDSLLWCTYNIHVLMENAKHFTGIYWVMSLNSEMYFCQSCTKLACPSYY